MIDLRVASVARPTGRILTRLLQERGLEVGTEYPSARVCYGWGHEVDIPTLNASAGMYDKFAELTLLHEAGIPVPRHSQSLEPLDYAEWDFPIFARKLGHSGGRDILPVLDPVEIPLRLQAGFDYFTEIIPVVQEFRVWMYRGRHLATYEKVMRWPERFRRYGCNAHNGYAFVLHDEVENLTRVAGNAVDALKLDFGGVDVVIGFNNMPFVLEVNTAPGIQGDHRQAIVRLANKIAKWVELGHPARKRRDEDGD